MATQCGWGRPGDVRETFGRDIFFRKLLLMLATQLLWLVSTILPGHYRLAPGNLSPRLGSTLHPLHDPAGRHNNEMQWQWAIPHLLRV